MKVLHVIPSLSPKHGGPSAALPAIARALIARGVEVTIATTDDDGAGCRIDVPIGELTRDVDGAERIHFRKNTEFYKVSLGLRQWLRAHGHDFDLVHIHALFSFSSVAAAHAAKRGRVPYVVRPLGVLNRWGMENRRRAIKAWSLRLIDLPILRGAATIHYTAEAERREAAEAHPTIGSLPSVVIPLPVAMSDAAWGSVHDAADADAKAPVVLFLSRIDQKKGIELLLEAFAGVRKDFPDAVLMLAGDGDPNYVAALRTKAESLGIAANCRWPGFLSGAAKARAFSEATLFVLPSYSENFGIAAAEALAAGIPCVLSENVAVAEDARTADAALLVRCDERDIAGAIRKVLSDQQLCKQLARRGRELVREKFSPDAVGLRLVQLYEELTTPQSHA